MPVSFQAVRLTVAHLYPDQLNIYADRGNVAVFERRAAWRNVELTVVPISRDEPFPPRPDLIYIGGGQDREQGLIAPDLARRESDLRACVDRGAALLAVCGGYQLLGRFYRGPGRARAAGCRTVPAFNGGRRFPDDR